MEKKDNTYEPGQETESNLEKLPKTKFEQIDVDTETELVYSFMNDNGWKHVFDSKYPELRVIQNAGKNKDECMTGYRKFIEEIHAKDREKMIHAQEQMGQEWGKIESVFFEVLSEHFETGWPEDKKEIVGYISMLPVFPRFLDKYSFCIGYKDLQSMVETSAHE
ncbi:MAG: hypothetical protein KGJ35_03380, partial [Patescibacteria group bacterium]|nr:hypothetical protein [Patescibacteria group bacterium]